MNLYPELNEAVSGKASLIGTPGRSLVISNGGGNFCGACIVPSNIPFIPNGSTPVTIAYFIVADNSPTCSLFSLEASMSAGVIIYTKTLLTNAIPVSFINGGANGVLPAQIIVLDQVSPSGKNLLFVVVAGKAYLYSFGKPLTGISIAAGGTGYVVGDTGTILGWGGYQATYVVVGTSGTTVASVSLVNTGSGYSSASAVATQNGGAHPGAGTGLTLNITAGTDAWRGYQIAIPNTDVSFANYINSATFIDGYVVVSLAPNTTGAGSRQFYNSAVNDASSWDPRSVSTKEGNPDPIQAVYAFNELLAICGTQTTELWYDAGVSASGSLLVPFQRISGGGVITTGLGSTWAITKVPSGPLAWLDCDASGNAMAWILSGYTPQRISTHAIENAWRTYNVTAASLYTYEENGHIFLVFNFPIAPNGPDGTLSASTTGATWAYDLTSQMWHQRGSYSGTTAPTTSFVTFNNELPRFHAFVQNVGHLMLDYFNGNIYIQSLDIYSDVSQNSGSSNKIARLRRTPHSRDGLRRITYPYVRVLAQATSTSPQMTLSVSNDGGTTYTPISTIGQATNGANWTRTGYAQDRVFQLFSTDAVQQAWVEGTVQYVESANLI